MQIKALIFGGLICCRLIAYLFVTLSYSIGNESTTFLPGLQKDLSCWILTWGPCFLLPAPAPAPIATKSQSQYGWIQSNGRKATRKEKMRV